MPLKQVEPELFMTHNGIRVYHTYNGENYDDRSDYWYTLDVHEDPDNLFDVRELPGWHKGTDHYEDTGNIIRAALDSGALKPPSYATPSFDTFKVECINRDCRSDDLVVVEAKHCQTGMELRFVSKLEPDGFEVPVTDDMDGSTEDEIVQCRKCGHRFPLCDLLID